MWKSYFFFVLLFSFHWHCSAFFISEKAQNSDMEEKREWLSKAIKQMVRNISFFWKEYIHHMNCSICFWQMNKWKESTNYACLKGEHNFIIMTMDQLKGFIAILFVSECTELPVKEMYSEWRENWHNLLVSSMMGKNEFEKCKKYLKMSDNNNLNMADRFAKVHPLLNSINEQCLLN